MSQSIKYTQKAHLKIQHSVRLTVQVSEGKDPGLLAKYSCGLRAREIRSCLFALECFIDYRLRVPEDTL